MRTREEVLSDLIHCKGNVNLLQLELSQFAWDIEYPLVTLTPLDLKSILQCVLEGEINLTQLTLWANIIECREDIGTTNKETEEIIFRLANPELHNDLTKNEIREMINFLSSVQ